jgi:cytochrome b involved in lipid metabolism
MTSTIAESVSYITSETTNSTPQNPITMSNTSQPVEALKKGDEFIVKYEGVWYDIAGFLDHHPAGRSVIEEHKETNGIDITEIFDNVGHSDYAKKVMMKYRLKSSSMDEELSAKKQRQKVTYDFNFVRKKLFTKEDEYLVHKFFGFLALLSYAYRHLYVLPTTGSLGFHGNWFDNLTLIVHFMLTFTSLIFHVLERRIVEKPLIIYEEYRLHAILFTGRAVLVSIFGMYINHFVQDVMTQRVLLPVIILTIHLVVDYVTSRYGTKGVTAVRVTNDGELKALKLFYSYYQFAALGSHLIVNNHLCDLGFNTLIAIQSSAFLMTLRRKSLIRWQWHAVWYSFALALSYYYMWLANGSTFFVYVGLAFALRTQFNANKYALWLGYVLTIYAFNLQ